MTLTVKRRMFIGWLTNIYQSNHVIRVCSLDECERLCDEKAIDEINCDDREGKKYFAF
jgi:hypothetical protein